MVKGVGGRKHEFSMDVKIWQSQAGWNRYVSSPSSKVGVSNLTRAI